MFEFIDKIKDKYRQNRVEKLLNVQKSLNEIEDRIEELSKAQSHKYIRKEPDGKGGFNYIYKESNQQKLKNQKEDFLYVLKSDYVIDYDKKDKNTFNNFYRNIPNEMLEDLCISKMIGNFSNNLPENLVSFLSKSKISLQSPSKYERESGGYWVGAYDEGFNEININREVYAEIATDWYGQEQFVKVLTHEYGHLLYRKDKVDSEVLFNLWETGERVSKQSRLDYEENFCESFAGYMMALSGQGDTEDNVDLNDFKEEFPKTAEILKQLIVDLHE